MIIKIGDNVTVTKDRSMWPREGQKVFVVQKTKKTPGVITKINQSRCVVDMLGRSYRVPMSMLEAA